MQAEDPKLAGEIRTWLSQVMKDTGLSVTDWALAAKVARTTVARPLKDDYPYVTSSRTLAKLAEAAGVPPPGISRARDDMIVPHFLPTRYQVQAGLWYEIDEYAQDFPAPPQPVAPDPRYADWPQWLEVVRGDSVDRIIGEGSFAHVVDAIAMGYAPKHGDLVVVERRRANGTLRERTIKEVSYAPDGIELWPRSHNDKWSTPLALTEGCDGRDDIEVEIVGLVIGAYRSFRN